MFKNMNTKQPLIFLSTVAAVLITALSFQAITSDAPPTSPVKETASYTAPSSIYRTVTHKQDTKPAMSPASKAMTPQQQMPSIIKKIYLELIESDSQLKTLEKQLNALKDTYQMAVEIISMLKEHSKEFLEEAFPSEECDINADVLIYKDLSFLQEEWES